MKCPACVEEGTRSRVTPEGGMTTLMHCPPYYDEDGVYHSHDLNAHNEGYRCSNNHRFARRRLSECPNCDFGKDSETVTILEPIRPGELWYVNPTQEIEPG